MLSMSVNDSYAFMIDNIQAILERVAAMKTILVTASELFREPWMNVKLCKMNSKCKRLFKRFYF